MLQAVKPLRICPLSSNQLKFYFEKSWDFRDLKGLLLQWICALVLNYKKIFCLHASPVPTTHLFTVKAELECIYAKIKNRIQAAQQARKTVGLVSSAISTEVLLLVLIAYGDAHELCRLNFERWMPNIWINTDKTLCQTFNNKTLLILQSHSIPMLKIESLQLSIRLRAHN